ncbi:MAG: glycosyltransferase family 4 protein [Candidatus Eiseniibacteriota bacterium]
MKVALLAEYPAAPDRMVGGVQAVVRRLAAEMAARPGLEVHAVSIQSGLDGPVEEELEGVHVHRFAATRRFGNLTLGRAERRVTVAALRRIRPDIVHAHVLGPPALAAADSGVPWVATAHGMQGAEGRAMPGWVARIRSGVRVRMERMCLRRLDHLIVISPYVAEYFAGRLDGVTTHPIENPVDERFFLTKGRRERARVMFAGRLIPRKDVETLLAACGILARGGVAFDLRVAGGADDPAYEQALRSRAAGEGVGDRCDFLGSLPTERMEAELSACGVFVQSSRQETASVAVMEAMAAGCAVVATDAGGTRHLLEGAGRVVPVGDAAALADALAELLADPTKQEEAGRLGREAAVRRFRVGPIVDRTLAVYERALAGRRAPAHPDNPLDREAVIA